MVGYVETRCDTEFTAQNSGSLVQVLKWTSTHNLQGGCLISHTMPPSPPSSLSLAFEDKQSCQGVGPGQEPGSHCGVARETIVLYRETSQNILLQAFFRLLENGGGGGGGGQRASMVFFFLTHTSKYKSF